MKYRLHPDYTHLQHLIDHIEEHFQDSSHILHAARNEIRVVECAGEDYVVKSFKVPNIINRFAYRYIRPSKAKRSYEYSLKLGSDTCPEPVAYIEQFHQGGLSRSYYISRYFKYDFTIRPILRDELFENRTQLLQKFSEFSYDLHQRGILHRDFSPGNILIKKQGEGYLFKVVDINRMQFRSLNLKDRLTNFVRLTQDDATMKIILDRYAQLMNKPQGELLTIAIGYRDKYARRRDLKNKLRGR